MDEDKLRQAKELHAPQGRWCDVCIEGGSMDSERQEWPCDTAELLYTPAEIQAVFDALRRDYEDWLDTQRAGADILRHEDPDAFWALVEDTEAQLMSMRKIRTIWSKEILFQSMPILRYSKIQHADGSVDDHLQTGRYAQ